MTARYVLDSDFTSAQSLCSMIWYDWLEILMYQQFKFFMHECMNLNNNK